MFQSRGDRILAAIVAGVMVLMGAAELAARLDDPAPLFFWLPTLWGGAALILTGGLFRPAGTSSKVLVVVGGVIGLLPTAWTVIVPILTLILIYRALTFDRASTAA